LEILPTLTGVDAVVTDPPYGVVLGSRVNNGRERDAYESFDDSPEALESIIRAAMPHMLRIARRCVLTPGVRNQWKWPTPTHVGAIFQPAGAGCNAWGFSCWQPIFYYGEDPFSGKGSRPDSFQCTEAAEKNGHPCPKPIGLWTKVLHRVSLEGETILDPFAGSGTTGVACLRTNRRFIGIEIDEHYAAIAAKRLARAEADVRNSLPFPEPQPRPKQPTMFEAV
jgi:DNA modification methylase